MQKSFIYKGDREKTYSLVESGQMVVLRTLAQADPDELLASIPAIASELPFLQKEDAFPESSVYIYSCPLWNAARRDAFKKAVAESGHPDLRFIGTVMVLADSGIYQIYTGNIFLKFRDWVPEQEQAVFLKANLLLEKRKLSFLGAAYFLEDRCIVGRDIFDHCLQLLQMPEVEYCHPELVVKRKTLPSAREIIDTTLLQPDIDWALRKTRVPEAWEITRGKGVRICVIDDGLEFEHPAFSQPGKIVGARDMKDSEILPRHQFAETHGTACASIACSADPAAPGVAPEAQLIPIRTMGLGSVLEADAFYWAVLQGADVISCSWGPPDGNFQDPGHPVADYPMPDHTYLAIRYAATQGRGGKGCAIFFAAGNGAEAVINDKYAANEYVMAIAATNLDDRLTVYSDYGNPVFACFPSGDYLRDQFDPYRKQYGIKVADRLGRDGYSPDDYYPQFDGTSASCPGAAGIAALVLSVAPQLDRLQLREILRLSCKKIGRPGDYFNGYSQPFGHGLLQAYDALQLALSHPSTQNRNLMASGKPKAVSLHIGIDYVDDAYYKGQVPPLAGCVNDMRNMEALAKERQYETHILTNENARSPAILDFIRRQAGELKAGDIFLLTYAGHGTYIPNTDPGESEKFDQAWVTFDRFLLDDELYKVFCEFAEGVRILMISDSCNSGTMSRAPLIAALPEGVRSRLLPPGVALSILSKNGQTARSLRTTQRARAVRQAKARIKLLAACQDDQFAQEINGAGVFTTSLLKVLEAIANQPVNYSDFLERIGTAINMPNQKPKYSNEGGENAAFDGQFPFEIALSAAPITGVEATVQDPRPPKPARKKRLILSVTTSEKNLRAPQNASRALGNEPFADIQVFDGAVDATDLAGRSSWDKAYELVLSNQDAGISYAEPDVSSNLFHDLNSSRIEENARSTDTAYLDTYPNPVAGGARQPFIWHLDEEHSRLKEAAELAFPEMSRDQEADLSDMVRIAHIDTGYLPNHPLLPRYLDQKNSRSFTRWGTDDEGAADYDVDYYPAEEQGHGNATLAILAGNYVRFDQSRGEYQGYFGGAPFARVLSLKISDTVVLLSGRNFAEAIDYAIEQKCDVITMSMAGLPSKRMAEAVNRAYEAGIVVVSAGGNSWEKSLKKMLPKTLLYPARFDRVIAAVGAAFDDRPYLYDLHNPGTRAAGGRFMQSNFGPETALSTCLAAYTPNLVWFDQFPEADNGQSYFVRSGGGTSSATPQIAAAAALYLYHYRSQIAAIPGLQPWQKVEIVKAALFRSAKESSLYQNYYGNGILNALEALQNPAYSPQNLFPSISQAPEAKVSGGFFKRLFGLFRSRGLQEQHLAPLEEMLQTELLQLLHREPDLHRFLQIDPLDDKAVISASDEAELIAAVQASDKASDFLKRNLRGSMQLAASGSSRNFSAVSGWNNILLASAFGEIGIRAAGVQFSILDQRSESAFEHQTEWTMDEIEIEITGVGARGTETPQLIIEPQAQRANFKSAMLVEREENGEYISQWIFEDDPAAAAAGGSSRGLSGLQTRGFSIDLVSQGLGKSRGLFDGKGKFIVKIFKWIFPKLAKNAATPVSSMLSKASQDKYGIWIYDLQREADPSGRSWLRLDNWGELDILKDIQDDPKPLLFFVPGLLSKVQDGFDEFLSQQATVDTLKKKFCRYVIGFNMPTLVDGCDTNADVFIKLLGNKLKGKKTHVIARSRGGLVARFLFEIRWKNAPTAPMLLEKLIMTGTCNRGTPIVESKNWKALLTAITNSVGRLTGPASPAFELVSTLLAAITEGLSSLPGMDDQKVGSDIIKQLREIDREELRPKHYYAVSSNFEPRFFLWRILDELVADRKFFGRVANDICVPVESALMGLPPTNYVLMTSSEAVKHFDYLKAANARITARILQWLT